MATNPQGEGLATSRGEGSSDRSFGIDSLLFVDGTRTQDCQPPITTGVSSRLVIADPEDNGPLTFDGGSGWTDTMLCTLGRIVLQFSALEWCAERLLAGFIVDSELVMLVVAGQDVSWKLDRLRQVHAELAQSEATDVLKTWVEGAEKLNARRNELVHSVWTTGPNGTPIGFRARRRGRFLLRGLAADEPMLAEFLDQVTGWTVLAVTISAALTGHPQWKGHPLDQDLTATAEQSSAEG